MEYLVENKEVKELTSAEVEEVNGGIVPILVGAALLLYSSEAH